MFELFFPRDLPKDIGIVIDKLIVDTHKPERPPIAPGARVACIGSCFAQEIANSLGRSGKKAIPLFLSERMNTAFALNYTVANVLDGTPFPDGFMPDHVSVHASGLADATAYIITLGLSTCWYERDTNRMVVTPRSPATHSLGGLTVAIKRYEMRQTSVAENVAQISALVSTIKRCKPDAPIVLTLSPIPLVAVTSGSPIEANIVSKATLKIAISEVINRNEPNVFYWPSYEIVEWYGKYVKPIWGQGENDLRHLEPEFIDMITRRFMQIYFASN